MDIEHLVVDAIGRQFFEPRVMSWNQDGTPYMTPSPFASMADQLFQQQRGKILELVIERIDLDELAGKIADRLIASLAERPSTFGWRNNEAEQFHKDVRAAVIDKVATAQAATVRALVEKVT